MEIFEKKFTLDNAKKYLVPESAKRYEVFWSENKKYEEINVLYESRYKEMILVRIHVDALYERTWDNLDWAAVNEIYLEKNDVEIINKFMRGERI